MRNKWKSGNPWESVFGYSSAIQLDEFIQVPVTNDFMRNKIVGLGDITLQTEFSFKKIQFTLLEVGFDLSDMISIRNYVTNIPLWEKVAVVYSYLFENSIPAYSIVEVFKLIYSEILILVEATALYKSE